MTQKSARALLFVDSPSTSHRSQPEGSTQSQTNESVAPKSNLAFENNICWLDLGCANLQKTREFYRELMDWEFEEERLPGEITYCIAKVKNRAVAALYDLSEEQRAVNLPPHWLTYFQVCSADQSTLLCKAKDGHILSTPFNVKKQGRMSIVQDPNLAIFALWEPQSHTGFEATHSPGSYCWSEIYSKQPEASCTFYHEVFDWNSRQDELAKTPSTLFFSKGQPVAAIAQDEKIVKEVFSSWVHYFCVDHCEATLETADALGAKVVLDSTYSDLGTRAIIQDREGAVFGIIEPAK